MWSGCTRRGYCGQDVARKTDSIRGSHRQNLKKTYYSVITMEHPKAVQRPILDKI